MWKYLGRRALASIYQPDDPEVHPVSIRRSPTSSIGSPRAGGARIVRTVGLLIQIAS